MENLDPKVREQVSTSVLVKPGVPTIVPPGTFLLVCPDGVVRHAMGDTTLRIDAEAGKELQQSVRLRYPAEHLRIKALDEDGEELVAMLKIAVDGKVVSSQVVGLYDDEEAVLLSPVIPREMPIELSLHAAGRSKTQRVVVPRGQKEMSVVLEGP